MTDTFGTPFGNLFPTPLVVHETESRVRSTPDSRIPGLQRAPVSVRPAILGLHTIMSGDAPASMIFEVRSIPEVVAIDRNTHAENLVAEKLGPLREQLVRFGVVATKPERLEERGKYADFQDPRTDEKRRLRATIVASGLVPLQSEVYQGTPVVVLERWVSTSRPPVYGVTPPVPESIISKGAQVWAFSANASPDVLEAAARTPDTFFAFQKAIELFKLGR